MKQILLYSSIYSYTAETFIEKMSELDNKEPVTIRVNSPGGSVFAGWGMVRSIQEHKGEVVYKVDGIAASMAFYNMLFADKVEALDVSRFLIHRADGYTSTEEDKKELSNINVLIRKHLEKRVTSETFKQVTGYSIDDVFAKDKRIDIWVSSKDAKKMGLVDKITRLEPREIQAIGNIMDIAASAFNDSSRGSDDNEHGSSKEFGANNSNNKISKTMNLDELKAQHPGLYNQVLEAGKDEGFKAGVKAEKLRVKGWLAYIDVDNKTVVAAIRDDKEFDNTVIAEMSVKVAAKAKKGDLEDDSTEELSGGKPEDKTAEQQEIEAYEKTVMENAKKINIY